MITKSDNKSVGFEIYEGEKSELWIILGNPSIMLIYLKVRMLCGISRAIFSPVLRDIYIISDRRLTWHKHIFTKRKQLGLTLTKMHWLLGRNSQHSTTNKLLLYKTILKPIWTYGIQLWGTASTSNIEILERFHLRSCVWLWMPHGTSLSHSSEGTSAVIQPKKKSTVTALTMVIDFAPIPIISQ
jgi:hypothetical protein